MTLRLTLLCPALLVASLALPAAAMTVRGTVSYEKILVRPTGLDLAHPVVTPAPRIEVEVRDAADRDRVLARGATDDGGGYALEIPDTAGPVVLWMRARSGKIEVRAPDAMSPYVVSSTPFPLAAAPARQVIPDQNRLSGPFNILAALSRANRALEAIDPDLPLAEQEFVIYWSPTADAGTYFDVEAKSAYVLGRREEDSDEFDDSVLIHEYAHYLAERYSRDDSPGGILHYPGDRLDPRMAWSEGWANFFAQAVLRSPVYLDSAGPGGAELFSFDLDEDRPEWDDPGYWSEHSVGAVLWDLFADPSADSGQAALDLQPIWHVLRERFPAQLFPYLLTLADGLIQEDGARDAGVTRTLSKQLIDYRFGAVPPVKVPFPRPITSGSPVTGSVDSSRSERVNLLNSADFYLFRKETEGEIEILLRVTGSARPAAADLVLVLYGLQGEMLRADEQRGIGSLERLQRSLPAGLYVIGVESFRRPPHGEERFGSAEYELTAEF